MAGEQLKVKMTKAEFIEKLNKELGQGAATCGTATSQTMNVSRFSSNIVELDHALGGGWPFGRISVVAGEYSTGKSEIALQACASIVNYDHRTKKHKYLFSEKELPSFVPGTAMYVDVEGAFDPVWAALKGFDVNHHILVRPESAEQAIDAISFAIDNNQVDLIILDSIAQMTPAKEIETSAEDWQMGLAARMNNKACRKWMSLLMARSRVPGGAPALLMLNQFRLKIGLCCEYHAKVKLADGTTKPIGQIVNERDPVEVLSYNEVTKEIESKKIVDWFKNPQPPKYLKVSVKGGKNGKRSLKVTPDHLVFTFDGWKEARNLSIGDKVGIASDIRFSVDQHKVILGSILGDGSLRFEKDGNRGHLRVGHGLKQSAYCQWKAEALGEEFHATKTAWFETCRTEEMNRYKSLGLAKADRKVTTSWSFVMDAKVFAIWYQDDGTFGGSYARWGFGKCSIAAKSLSRESLEAIQARSTLLGLGTPTIREGKGLMWTGEESGKFQRGISKYVHPSMRYKLKPGMPEFDWEVSQGILTPSLAQSTIIGIQEVSEGRGAYDIEVEGNHNYFIGDTLIHNCFGDPRTLPGGKGQEFVSSVIVYTRAGKLAESEAEVELGGVVWKNKTFPPKKVYSASLGLTDGAEYGRGMIDNVSPLVAPLKAGGWLTGNQKKWTLFGNEIGDTMALRKYLATNDKVRYKVWRTLNLHLCKYDGA